MRYVSIDIETTGVDRERCQVLEIGAVVEDSNNPLPLEELPVFRALIYNEELYWEDVAYGMHKESGLLDDLENTSREKLKTPDEMAQLFAEFLIGHGFPLDKKGRVRVVAAGKNLIGFDKDFLKRIPVFKEKISIIQRALDPTLHYTDFANDEEPPSMKVCKERAGIVDTKVAHRAVDDALDVVRLLRPVYALR